MPTVVSLSEAKTKFSEFVERASLGEDIVITRRGHAIVRMIRFEPANPNRRLGLLKGRIRLADDFDEWPEDIARDLEIRQDQ